MKQLFPRFVFHPSLEPRSARDQAEFDSLRAQGYGTWAEIHGAQAHVCQPGETYREHQAAWESKKDKAEKLQPAQAEVTEEPAEKPAAPAPVPAQSEGESDPPSAPPAAPTSPIPPRAAAKRKGKGGAA